MIEFMNAFVVIECSIKFLHSLNIFVIYFNVLGMIVNLMDIIVGSFIIAYSLNSLDFKSVMS